MTYYIGEKTMEAKIEEIELDLHPVPTFARALLYVERRTTHGWETVSDAFHNLDAVVECARGWVAQRYDVRIVVETLTRSVIWRPSPDSGKQ
jgi:hypothetical protein